MKKPTYEELEEMYKTSYQRTVEANVRIGELLSENKKLKKDIESLEGIIEDRTKDVIHLTKKINELSTP